MTQDSGSAAPRDSLALVLERQTPALLQEPGVVGTAEGRHGERPIFLILVERRSEALDRKLPRMIEGYPVEIREVGPVRPLPR